MDIIHTKITFIDTFSSTEEVKITTLSKATFDKIRSTDIGKVVPYFNKETQIHYTYKIKSIEQA